MKKLSLALCLAVSGFAGTAFAQFEPLPGVALPNLMCQEQFGTNTTFTSYLVVLGNTGIVVDAPANDPFSDVCVYFPNSQECKDRQNQPPKPGKAAVRLYLSVEAVTLSGNSTVATGAVSTRGAEVAPGRFQLNLEYGNSGLAAKLDLATGARFFNCRANGGNTLK